MHPKVLKELSDVIAEPLADVFRKSLAESTLPHQWKVANVTPLFKKGDKSKAGNYRPVSLTSIPCKIMEKVVRDSVFQHLKDNNLLSVSTVLCLIVHVQQIFSVFWINGQVCWTMEHQWMLYI
jgi:hypothetical protein